MSEVTLTSFTKQSSMFSIIRWVLLCCYHSHIIKDADMILDNLLLFIIVKIIVHFGGLSPPLLPKCFALLGSIVHCYMVIEASLIVDYTVSILN